MSDTKVYTYEPSSEPHRISAKQLFLNRELFLSVQLTQVRPTSLLSLAWTMEDDLVPLLNLPES